MGAQSGQMRTELFISWRYLVTKRKEKFISLISIISVLGVAIGVMALIIVIAVMTGFDKDLRDKIVGNFSHITLTSFKNIDNEEYNGIIKKIAPNPHVIGISPNLQGQVLVKEGSKFFAVALKGIDPYTEPRVTKINNYVISGAMDALSQEGVIIGKELAMSLGLSQGLSLLVYSPTGKQYNLKIVGLFNSGMYDYDLNLIFTNIKTAQDILGMGSNFSSVAIKLDDLYLAQKVRADLTNVLGGEYILKTWAEANKSFFAALKLEKLTMFIILTLIILVASFNIISTLIVLVVDKTKDIGILKTIGMNARQIRNIFIYEGAIIGLLGIFFGSVGGITLCVLLKKYQFIELPQDIYYINKLPVYIELWPDIGLIVLAAIAITLISTIYPSIKAAGLKPVEALRYE